MYQILKHCFIVKMAYQHAELHISMINILKSCITCHGRPSISLQVYQRTRKRPSTCA